MAQILVRKLNADVKARLQRRARRHGRSMEEEARAILREAVEGEPAGRTGLGSRIAARFAKIGLDEAIPELHGHPVRPAKFSR